MGTKFFALLFLANICLVTPLQLTKEIVPKYVQLEEINAKTNPPTLEEIVQALANSNILEDLVYFIIKSQADTILALAEKIESNSENLEEIFETLNVGLGANILKVTNETLFVDTAQLAKFALNQVKNLAQALFPNDVFQQMVFYGVGSQQVKNVLTNIKNDLENIGLPLKVLAAVLPKIQAEAKDTFSRSISNRDATSDLVNIIFTLFKTPICNVLSSVVTVVNSIVSSVAGNITSLTIDTSSITNSYIQIVAQAYNSGLAFLEDLTDYAMDIVKLAYNSTCTSSLRKRRDVDEIQYLNRLSDSSDVLEIKPEGRSLRNRRDLWTTIAAFFVTLYTNFIGPVLNVALKGFISESITFVQGIVDTFLNTTVVAIANTLINTITLQS